MTRAILLILVATVTLGALLPSPADAQRRRRRAQQQQTAEDAAPAPTLGDLETILPKLQSANADEVREAIDLLSVIDRPEVIPHLAELLRSGQPDAITDRTLEALGGLAHPRAIDALAAFTHHRRIGARRRAYQGLAAIRNNRIPPPFSRAA